MSKHKHIEEQFPWRLVLFSYLSILYFPVYIAKSGYEKLKELVTSISDESQDEGISRPPSSPIIRAQDLAYAQGYAAAMEKIAVQQVNPPKADNDTVSQDDKNNNNVDSSARIYKPS